MMYSFKHFPPLLFLLCWNYSAVNCSTKSDRSIKIPYNQNQRFFLPPSVGRSWYIEQDIPIHDFIRENQILQIQQLNRKQVYDEETKNLNKDDGEYHKFDYRKIVKKPVKGPHFKTIADWFLYYKGRPFSLIACCVIILPVLYAGLIQTCLEGFRSRTSRISERTWEFPLVPVLLLQQSRREYLLRKKTVRRFCIQWEVGRINIRMNTKLVDLRQILHPPRKQKKVHKYTTWRIIRLITRFNAFLASRREAARKNADVMKAVQRARIRVWNRKINTSRYMVEKTTFDTEQEMESKKMSDNQVAETNVAPTPPPQKKNRAPRPVKKTSNPSPPTSTSSPGRVNPPKKNKIKDPPKPKPQRPVGKQRKGK